MVLGMNQPWYQVRTLQDGYNYLLRSERFMRSLKLYKRLLCENSKLKCVKLTHVYSDYMTVYSKALQKVALSKW